MNNYFPSTLEELNSNALIFVCLGNNIEKMNIEISLVYIVYGYSGKKEKVVTDIHRLIKFYNNYKEQRLVFAKLEIYDGIVGHRINEIFYDELSNFFERVIKLVGEKK